MIRHFFGRYFFSKPEDLEWLRETHLKGRKLPEFESFEIVGNEDCPEIIELYQEANPKIYDKPVMIFEYQDQEYLEVEVK